MVSIYDHVDYRKYLSEIYREKKRQNAHVSHRYIEQHIHVSPGYFSRIVKGEKNLTDGLLLQFTQFLKLNKKESAYFECMVKYAQAKDANTRAIYYARLLEHGPEIVRKSLQKEQFAFFQDPHHVVVHGLINVLKISPASDLSAIGKLLLPPLTSKKVHESIELLLKLRLITIDKQGRYRLTGQILTTGDHPKEATLRKFLMDSFTQARDAVDRIPECDRASSIMTVSVSENTFGKIKEKLAAVRSEINQLISADTNLDRVYQLGMYLIPVTQKIITEDKNG